MALSNTLEPKKFANFLTGLTKLVFYNDDAYSVEAIREELFSDVEEDAANATIAAFIKLLRFGAKGNVSRSQLAEQAKSEGLGDDHADILAQFWKNESGKVRTL
eukprot:TRINITY_DN1134_c0_g1_i1.p1 TRINITY_DN1134_c0_g1~~TRINITY_DN1134_c0_g1_i1.p1  ORF type:complete len:104 (-),score=30.82 TRINITY_DN1134_c0_g1_i1:336-647(-)